MRNTKTGYTRDQRMSVILPEMEQLLPPLSVEQFSSLERDILENGCYTSIVVNEELVIVDGHNRFRICEKHRLPFRMLVFSFANLLEAKQWALGTQRGRRNLSLWELGQIALKLKPELESAAKTSQGLRTDLSVNSPKGCTPVDTRKEMARAVGIGEQTMGRITRLYEDAPRALKNALERKEVSVNRGWKILKAVQQLPTEERETAAAEMIAAVREINQIDAEADRREKIVSLFCKAYERAVLLTPTSENIRCWVEGTRMRPEEIEDAARESYELAQVFQTIGDVLRHEFLPCQEGKLDTESENQGVA